METLGTLSEKLQKITTEISVSFSKMQVPENVHLVRDKYWGLRSVQINLRLDEFSPDHLKTELKNIEKLFTQFKILREEERNLIEELNIQRHIEKEIINSYY